MNSVVLAYLNVSMFFIVYRFNPFGVLPFAFDKIFLVIGLPALLFLYRKERVQIFSKTVLILLAFLLYGSLVSLNLTYTINHQVYRFSLLIFEALGTSVLFVLMYKRLNLNIYYILKVIFWCVLIQSVLIVLSFLFSGVFNFLNIIAPLAETNFDIERTFRLYRGLCNAPGSSLSLILSLGALISFYLFFYEKKLLYILSLIPIFLATALNGRTGVILILLFSIVFGLFNIKNGKLLKMALFSVLIVGLVNQVSSSFFSYSSDNERIYSWYSEAFSFLPESKTDDRFYNSFTENHIFLPNTLTGVIFGVGSDLDENFRGRRSDSGIIKNIFSFGLPITIFFYALLVTKIFSSGNTLEKFNTYLSVCLVLALLIGDYKEPFLLKTFLSRLIFMVVISRNLFNRGKIYF